MNYIFFASGKVGHDILERLSFCPDSSYPKMIVITEANPSDDYNLAIGMLANKMRVPVHTFEHIFTGINLDQVCQLKPGLFILAWWPRILDPAYLSIPILGTLNLHPSYLPWGRGKHPNFWALVDEEPFGVTIHWATPRVDEGPIAWRKRIEYDCTDTGESLHKKAQEEIVNLFLLNFDKILLGNIPAEPQPVEFTTHFNTQIDKASHIRLNKIYAARDLINLIRARTYPGHPGAYFYCDGKKYEITCRIKEVKI